MANPIYVNYDLGDVDDLDIARKIIHKQGDLHSFINIYGILTNNKNTTLGIAYMRGACKTQQKLALFAGPDRGVLDTAAVCIWISSIIN